MKNTTATEKNFQGNVAIRPEESVYPPKYTRIVGKDGNTLDEDNFVDKSIRDNVPGFTVLKLKLKDIGTDKVGVSKLEPLWWMTGLLIENEEFRKVIIMILEKEIESLKSL